jgi:hypothetical protein
MDAPTSFAAPPYRSRRPRSFVFPMLLVIAGIVLLLNNLGVLSWSIWSALGQLWPAILILLGFELLIGRWSTWLSAFLAVVAFVAILGAAIWMTSTGAGVTPNGAAMAARDASIPLGSAANGQVAIQFGAGSLVVGALPPEGTDLAQITASLPGSMQLTQHSEMRGDTIDATIGTSGSGGGWPFLGFKRSDNLTLNARLAPQIPLDLRAEVGAGQSTFNLLDLMVNQFTLNNGAGQATIYFPRTAGQTTADIHSGAGQIILEVPPGVGAYIHGSSGLVNYHASNRYQKVADGYQTSDFATAANRVDVTMHVGIGEVDVR